MSTVASAPGKVIISGEYAVLDGAPAICMAINRRARADIAVADADFNTVRTHGHIDGEWRFRTDENGRFEWHGTEPTEGGLDLLQQAWRSTVVNGHLNIRLDSAEFLDPVSGSKLGLGSSAALTVALITALLNVTGSRGDAAKEAHIAHRRFQHGRGSGVDIAASLAGGIIEYRMQDAGVARSVPWPAGLEYAVLWSGRPASTSERLEKLDRGRRRPESGRRTAVLCEASAEIAMTWVTGTTAALLAVFERYVSALRQFDVDQHLGIFDAGHVELADAAAGQGLVYKPCGAGGGDAGIVLAADRQAIAKFTDAATQRGFQILDVSLDAQGAVLES